VRTPLIKPNLLVIGAQKGGTTWLHHCLDFHPSVFMSKIKELHFFEKSPQVLQDEFPNYCANFNSGATHRLRGESTPVYFWTCPEDPSSVRGYPPNRHVPETVRQYLGEDIWLLLALRCPVERAVSGFFHNFRAGRLDPAKSIFDQGHRFGILDRGHYKRHFLRWRAAFDMTRFVITLYDDIRSDPAGTARRLYQHLGLPPLDYTQGHVLRNPGLERAIVTGRLVVSPTSASKVNRKYFHGGMRADPARGSCAVTQSDVDRLAEFYTEDIRFVKDLLQRPDLRWGRRPLAEFVGE